MSRGGATATGRKSLRLLFSVISSSKLYGRLGNQLFQYAFLRTTAARLGTRFYYPPWEGDAIFDLFDGDERAAQPAGITSTFDQGPQAGYTVQALAIGDNTEIKGFFQSENYYHDKEAVRDWFAFKDAIKARPAKRYATNYLRSAVSLSLRIDADYGATREFFPLAPLSYYRNALGQLEGKPPLLVFADRPDLAREFFAPLGRQDIRIVTEMSAAEQLYLMTQCRANVIINSTFAWWGAWLNRRPERTIVCPAEWCRPGVPNSISGILCDDWVRARATIPLWDNFQVWRLRHPIATIKRVQTRLRQGRS